MIESLKIENLPYKWTKWERGDGLLLEWKSLLIIGDNGTGKSTFLTALYKSLVNNRLFVSGEGHLRYEISKNPYFLFVAAFDGEVYKLEWRPSDRDEEFNPEETDAEFLEAFEDAIENIFGEWLVNIWNPNYRTTENQFKKFLQEYVRATTPEFIDKINSFTAWEEGFLTAIELYSKKHQIELEVMYGTLMMIFRDTFRYLDTSITRFGYFSLQGAELAGKSIISWLAEPDEKESLGEKAMRLISLIQPQTIAILDEPTNGVALKRASDHLKNIEALKSVQMFASSHDGRMLDFAQNHPDWKIFDLDEKEFIKK